MARYEVFIPNWRPSTLNTLMTCHWRKASRLKKADYAMVAAYTTAIPKARGKRRVALHITLTGRQQKTDPFSYEKSCADALVRCKLLVDDSDKYIEWIPPTYDRGGKPGTRLILEDIGLI